MSEPQTYSLCFNIQITENDLYFFIFCENRDVLILLAALLGYREYYTEDFNCTNYRIYYNHTVTQIHGTSGGHELILPRHKNHKLQEILNKYSATFSLVY